MTKQEIKCLREHLNNIEESMSVIRKMLGTDPSEHLIPKLTKEDLRMRKYRKYIREQKPRGNEA